MYICLDILFRLCVFQCVCVRVCLCVFACIYINYGVATISRLLKMIALFCNRALLKKLYSAKETYNLKEPTNRRHPISCTTVYVLATPGADTKEPYKKDYILQKRPMI